MRRFNCFNLLFFSLNGDGIKATNRKFNTTLQPIPTLFLEFQSNELATNLRNAETAAAIAQKNGCLLWQVAEDSALDALWEARRYISSSINTVFCNN